MTRCFLKEETQVLECLTGPPASQQLHGAGPLPTEDEGGSQAAGVIGDFQAPFTLGVRAPVQPIEDTTWLAKPGALGLAWRLPAVCSFPLWPQMAWLCAPCPRPA